MVCGRGSSSSFLLSFPLSSILALSFSCLLLLTLPMLYKKNIDLVVGAFEGLDPVCGKYLAQQKPIRAVQR